jgi:hypothetical protein
MNRSKPLSENLKQYAKKKLEDLKFDLRKRLLSIVLDGSYLTDEKEKLETVLDIFDIHYDKMCEHSPESVLKIIFDVRKKLLK